MEAVREGRAEARPTVLIPRCSNCMKQGLKGSRPLVLAALLGIALFWPSAASAQVAPCPAPVKQPPANSPVLLRCVQLVAHPVNETVVEQETYQFYIKARGSISAQDNWVPYNEDAIQADFWNLWHTNFLDNCWVEVIDEPFDNGDRGQARHLPYRGARPR